MLSPDAPIVVGLGALRQPVDNSGTRRIISRLACFLDAESFSRPGGLVVRFDAVLKMRRSVPPLCKLHRLKSLILLRKRGFSMRQKCTLCAVGVWQIRSSKSANSPTGSLWVTLWKSWLPRWCFTLSICREVMTLRGRHA